MRTSILLALVWTAMASDAILTVDIPNLQQTRERLAASPYGPLVAHLFALDPMAHALPNDFSLLLAHAKLLDSIQISVALDEQGPLVITRLSAATHGDALWANDLPTSLHQLHEPGAVWLSNRPLAGPSLPAMQTDHDLSAHLDLAALLDQAPLGVLPEQAREISGVAWTMDVTDQGLSEVMHINGTFPAQRSIDPAILNRCDGDGTLLALISIDGPVLADQLANNPLFSDAAPRELRPMLPMISGILSSIQGDACISVSYQTPVPALLVAVPRSAPLDVMIAQGLQVIGAAVETDGAITVLPGPRRMPFPLLLTRDAEHWIFATDRRPIDTWLKRTGSGPLQERLATLVAGKTAAAAYDGADLLQALMLMANAGSSRRQMEATRGFVEVLLAMQERTGIGHVVQGLEATGGIVEGDGLLGSAVTPIALLAATTMPDLLESRSTANEAAAAASLRSGLFPAQVQFQAGGYVDNDNDAIGRYCDDLKYLAGATGGSGPQMSLSLMGPDWRAGNGLTLNGYRYRIFTADNEDDAERYFAAYAWPEDQRSGSLAFTIDQTGQVFSKPASELGWFGEQGPLMAMPHPARLNARFDMASEGWMAFRYQRSRSRGGPDLGFLLSLFTPPPPPLSQAQRQLEEASHSAKQIFHGIIAYRSDHGGTFPDPWTDAGVERPVPATPEEAMLQTAAIFEYLAARMELAPQIFKLSTPARSDLAAIIAQPNPAYAAEWALDWSAPRSAGSMRPVMAHRQASEDGQVVVIFADGHYEIIAAQAGEPGPWRTQATTPLSASNPIFPEDDIYSAETEKEQTPEQIGRGDRKRAWVR